MINFLKKQKGTGALLDNRPESEKEKDYHLDELVANLEPVNWEEKDTWAKYPIYDQNGSGSCVAQTAAKMLGIMYQKEHGEYLHFSATDIYQRRTNRPGGGMIGADAGNIARAGTTLESLAPSQKMTDKQMDGYVIADYKRKVGDIFKINNFVQLKTQDIDAIASTIQKTGKPVMVWYYFKHNEWTTEPKVRYDDLKRWDASRHSVTAVDFFIKKGVKYLVIEDSWGTRYGKKGQRFISEDFHNKRNFFAQYFTNFDFAGGELPTKQKLTKTLKQGSRNSEVVILQDFLKAQKLFPSNVQSTGYFGSVTKRAVVEFQKKYELVADGIVGKRSRTVINYLMN